MIVGVGRLYLVAGGIVAAMPGVGRMNG